MNQFKNYRLQTISQELYDNLDRAVKEGDGPKIPRKHGVIFFGMRVIYEELML